MELLMPPTSPFLHGQTLTLRRKALITQRHNSSFLHHPQLPLSNLHLKCPPAIFTPQRSFPSFAMAATRGGEAATSGGSAAAASEQTLNRCPNLLKTLWTFLGPYTIQGTVLAATAWAARVYLERKPYLHITPPLLVKSVSALFALLCVQGFLVGINQIFDIEIDRINKPSRPLPSGDLSFPAAWGLIISMPVVGFLVLMTNKASPLLFCMYGFSLFLSAAYSVRPFRFKENPLAANLTIAVLRGILLNFGTYLALKATVPFPLQWSPPMTFITIFSSIIAFVFGIIKDLPDIEGDRSHGIYTPAVTLGPRKTTLLGAGIVMLIYTFGVAAPVFMPQYFNGMVMVPAHIVLASSLAFKVWLLDKANYGQKECQAFYMFIWSMYYVEQLLFPFI